ncbi:hypothetical protein C8R43DRAFT_1121514 [Mycena crocata]|nr:hypothetical protein C8R43DRAFT_1121514 [Mycena crocata]
MTSLKRKLSLEHEDDDERSAQRRVLKRAHDDKNGEDGADSMDVERAADATSARGGVVEVIELSDDGDDDEAVEPRQVINLVSSDDNDNQVIDLVSSDNDENDVPGKEEDEMQQVRDRSGFYHHGTLEIDDGTDELNDEEILLDESYDEDSDDDDRLLEHQPMDELNEDQFLSREAAEEAKEAQVAALKADSDEEDTELASELSRAAALETGLQCAAATQRKQAGLRYTPIVLEELLATYKHIASRELAVQQARPEPTSVSALEYLQTVVGAFCTAEGHHPIPANSPTWVSFTDKTVRFLVHLFLNPASWDPTPFVKDGTLRLCDRNEVPPTSFCAVYVRRVNVPDNEDVTDWVSTYLLKYLADAPTALLHYVLLGGNVDKLYEPFQTAMEPYGLGGVAQPLLDAVKMSTLNGLHAHGNSASYGGIASETGVGDRGSNDLRNDAKVRFVNYLKANGGDKVKYATYHIPDLDTPIDDQLDVRSCAEISEKERIIRAVLGGTALNSAHGGFLPIHTPPATLLSLRTAARAHYDYDPHPLGEEHAPVLEANITKLIEDELATISGLVDGPRISEKAMDGLLHMATAVRTLNKKVVKFELAKDITMEGFKGRVGSYWDANTGEGPREHRWMLHGFNPAITLAGDLTQDLLALHIGPMLDFWRLLLWHLLFWLHVLFMLRMLELIRPLLVVSQSNPIARMLRSGDLGRVSRFLEAADLASVFEGRTPEGITSKLPNDRYRSYRGGDFLNIVGTVEIIRIGRGVADFSLHVPRTHYGALKYDPSLARRRFNVAFLVEIVIETVTQIAARRLRETENIDWMDREVVLKFLGIIKEETETLLGKAGVTPALNIAKNDLRRGELALNFLRGIISSKRRYEVRRSGRQRYRRSPDHAYQRRDGIRTLGAPQSTQRQEQLQQIVEDAQELLALDLPPDPDGLGCLQHPLLSPSFDILFLKMPEGKDLVYAANARGRSAEAVQAVQKRAKRSLQMKDGKRIFVDWYAVKRQNLIRVIMKTAGAPIYVVSDFLQTCRQMICEECGEGDATNHNKGEHRCFKVGDILAITLENFSNAERSLHPHDILHDPTMLQYLGKISDVLAQTHLVAVSVSSILLHQRPLLHAKMHSLDFDALYALPPSERDVFVPEERQDDGQLLALLAVDCMLKHTTSTVLGEEEQPIHGTNRVAWKEATSDKLLEWYHRRTNNFCMAVCNGPPKPPLTAEESRKQPPPPRWWAFVANAVVKQNGKTAVNVKCTVCGNAKGDAASFHKLKTIFDLPSHHSRHLWYRIMGEVQFSPPRASKKGRR